MSKQKGSALLAVLFVSLIALSISISMMQLSSTKTFNAVNNKNALKAFYASESGINDALDVISIELKNNYPEMQDQPTAEELGLPEESAPENLDGAEYYVSITYPNSETIIVESTGTYKDAAKRMRVRCEIGYSTSFVFGLLSDNNIDINTGNITYGLDIHSNGNLGGNGNVDHYDHLDGAIGTQTPAVAESDKDKTDYWKVHRDAIPVPGVDFEYFQGQMAGAITPEVGDDLSSMIGITDVDNNVMITSDYLNSDGSITIPLPVAPDVNAKTKKENMIAGISNGREYVIASLLSDKNDSQPVNVVLNNITNIINLNIINSFIINNIKSLNLLNYVDQINLLDIDRYLCKHDPTPTPVPPNPTPEPTVAPDPTPEPTVEPTAEPTEDGDKVKKKDTPDPTPEPTIPVDDGGDDGGDEGDDGKDKGDGSSSGLNITLEPGDHGGRIYYIDNAELGEVTIDVSHGKVSNAIIVCTGSVRFNGANKAPANEPSGLIDMVIAAGGNIRQNGHNESGCFYWTNGIFDQNGSSSLVNGRVMAKGNISMSGKFSVTSTGALKDFEFIPRALSVVTWQQIAVD